MQNKNYVIFGLVIICAFAIYSLGSVLIPFVVGFVGAYTMNRPVSFLNIKLKIPRSLGALLILIIFVYLMVVAITVIVPFLKNEILAISYKMPIILKTVYAFIDPLFDFLSVNFPEENVANIKAQLTGHIGSVLTWTAEIIINILSSSLAIANLISLIVITPFVIFYLTKDWPEILSNIENIIPKKYKAKVRMHFFEIDKNLSCYAKGQVLICIILAILYSITLSVLGLKNAVMVGVITGILSFIPYVGAFIGFILSVLLHLNNSGTLNPILLIAFAFVSIQIIEGKFLIPKFIGDKIGVHPVLVLFSLLVGASWFGFLGMALALPVTAVIASVVRSFSVHEI